MNHSYFLESDMSFAEAPGATLPSLVRVTEAAALASARWLGRGDKNAGDGAAVDAMRLSFNSPAHRGQSRRWGRGKGRSAHALQRRNHRHGQWAFP